MKSPPNNPLVSKKLKAILALADGSLFHGMSIGIAGIDTRRLTRILREKGAQNGAIIAGDTEVDRALALARSFPGLTGMDLAKVVSTERPYVWTEAEWQLGSGYRQQTKPEFHVV